MYCDKALALNQFNPEALHVISIRTADASRPHRRARPFILACKHRQPVRVPSCNAFPVYLRARQTVAVSVDSFGLRSSCYPNSLWIIKRYMQNIIAHNNMSMLGSISFLSIYSAYPSHSNVKNLNDSPLYFVYIINLFIFAAESER